MTIYAGIDPGKTGAIALIYPDGEVEFTDMDKAMDDLTKLLDSSRFEYVTIEEQSSRPSQSSSATFTHAQDYGYVLGVLAALLIPHELVRPQRWMRHFGITAAVGATEAEKRRHAKKLHMAKAKALFPKAELYGPRGGALDGRADALLIAEFGRRTHGGTV